MKDKLINLLKDKAVYRFLIVGGTCTGLDFGIYLLVSPYTGVTVGKTISMLCSMLLNYLLNKFWTFDAADSKNIKEIPKYVLAQAANLSVNVSVNTLFMKITDNKIVSFIIATATAMIINFCLQRFWVFKSEKKTNNAEEHHL